MAIAATVPAQGAVASRVRRAQTRRWPLAPFLYLAPMILLLAVFTYWPLIHTVYLSFVQWNMNPDQPMRWVGTANYRGIFQSPLWR